MPKRSTKTTAAKSKNRANKVKKTQDTGKRKLRTTAPAAAPSNTTVFSSALKKSGSASESPRTTTSARISATSSDTSTSAVTTTNFTQLLITWFSFFLVTVIAFYAAAYLFPSYLVFGTDTISPFAGMLQSSALLSLIVVAAIPVIEMAAAAVGRKVTDSNWMVLYLLINTAGIWVISRFAEVVGMGISSWVVALVLGFVLNVAQGITYKMFISQLTSRDA